MAKSFKGAAKGQLEAMIKANTKEITKLFWKKLKLFNIVGIITKVIERGISPVAGKRFQKYSQNYIDQILGKSYWFSYKSGMPVKVEPLDAKELNTYRASKEAKRDNAKLKAEIKARAAKTFGSKKRSPVSMRLSGKMLDSLKFDENKGTLDTGDIKWVFHNEGMGKLPVRRLLPNKEGEEFSRLIQNKITEALSHAVGANVAKVRKLMKVSFKIK
jgi:hypothetical protein